MSTHNIGFYGEISKMIPKLSPNTYLICSTAYVCLWSLIENIDKKLTKAGHKPIYELQHDKTNKMSVCPAKTGISLGIHPD